MDVTRKFQIGDKVVVVAAETYKSCIGRTGTVAAFSGAGHPGIKFDPPTPSGVTPRTRYDVSFAPNKLRLLVEQDEAIVVC